MQGSRDGFVKLICRKVTGIVIGGVVVAPRASELIFPWQSRSRSGSPLIRWLTPSPCIRR